MTKPRSSITFILGIALVLIGIILIVKIGIEFLIPVLIGLSLCYLGWSGGRVAIILFGHICIIIGCYLITWGMYLLPYSKPIPAHIFGRPLFWGFFSLFGGVCAIYHGFCKCVGSQKDVKSK